MKKFSLLSFAPVILAAVFSLPAAAQMTYNFATGGNCNFPPATCTVAGSNTVANSLAISGWSAASGANFVASTITDQNGSGVGMTAAGEVATSPDHAIDNNGSLELVALNFGTNKVVLTGLSTGWSQNDTDVAVLRWTGATGPNLATTKVTDSITGLVAKGWAIVSSADLDTNAAANTQYGAKSMNTGLAVNAANSSSWWIVSSYFGGGSLGNADAMADYFKLMSVSATCVGSTSGGACNTTTGVPEPATLALVGAAMIGAVGARRRRQSK